MHRRQHGLSNRDHLATGDGSGRRRPWSYESQEKKATIRLERTRLLGAGVGSGSGAERQ